MGTASRAQLLLGVSLLSLGAQAAWPVKTIDLTNNGDDCEYEYFCSPVRLSPAASSLPLFQLDGLRMHRCLFDEKI